MKNCIVDVLQSAWLHRAVAHVKGWTAHYTPWRDRQEIDERAAAVRLYRQFVRPGDLCFDVGAHHGIRTDVFVELGARVIAVEPQPRCIAQLKRKYARNSRVVIVPNGLAEQEGMKTLYHCDRSTCASMSPDWIESVKTWERLRGPKWYASRTVSVTTLDRLIEEHGLPAFCKIDVEGFEFQVIRGLSRPIPSLSFEYNPRHLNVVAQCVDRLQHLGDYEFNYSEGDSMEMALGGWLTADGIGAEIRGSLPRKSVYGDIYARLRRR